VTHAIVKVLERALLVLGVLALAIFAAAHLDRAVSSRAALHAFEEAEDLTLPSTGATDFSSWSHTRVTAHREALLAPQVPPVAVLQIAKIRMEVPVFQGTDEWSLNRGAGWIQGTARPGEDGNVGIAGHRDGFFRGLKEIAVGDVVELRTAQGARQYRVDRVEIVGPEDVGVLEDRGHPTLTLVTCYPFYFIGHAPQRWVVQGSLMAPRAHEGRPS
jgi:sortase A